ncbi:MAG: efflux RND transporter permease subunit [Pikeienuella sp.]
MTIQHAKVGLRRFMRRFAAWVLGRRLMALAIVLVASAVMMSGLARLEFDTSPESFFLDGAPEIRNWENFKQKYQSDEFSFIVLSPEVADVEFVEGLRALTRDLEKVDGVERVTSLHNVRSITGEDSFIDVGDYLNEDLDETELLARLETAAQHPYYRGLFVDETGRKFGILVETINSFSNADKAGFSASLREILERPEHARWRGVAIGAPLLDHDVQAIVSAESGMFGSITFVLVMVGFAIAFRSRLAVALPPLVSILSISCALGAMGLWGSDAGLLTPIVPSFLISVGLGTAAYLMSDFTGRRRRGEDTREAIVETMGEAGGAALLANLTTAGALFAFSGSRVLAVRDVGLSLGLGLLAACLFTLILFPVLASLWGDRIKPAPSRDSHSPLMARLANLALSAPGVVVGVFTIVVLIAIAGVVKLKTDYYYLGTFKRGGELYQSYERANEAIPVANSIEVLVSLGQVDALKDPAALRAVDELAKRGLAAVDQGVPIKAYTLADVVKELNEQNLGDYAIPDERARIAQLILLFESSGDDELTRVTNPDFEEARLTFLVPSRPYSAFIPLVELIKAQAPALLAEAGYPEASVMVTGVVPLWMQISTFLTETQITSFLMASAFVALVMVLIARSLVIGLAMALINVGCVAIVLGVMGHLGVFLDPFTILIGAIALGMLDDDTIHFARGYLDRRKEGAGLDDALHQTFQTSGKAMGIQTLVLVVAFVVYTTGSVQSLATFGWITTLTILLGLVAEYTVTPAVLVLLTRDRKLRMANDPLPSADPSRYRSQLDVEHRTGR